MNWLGVFLGGTTRRLSAEQTQRLDRWQRLPECPLDQNGYRCRFVVVDTESSGPDPKRHDLISIGALAVCDGLIAPADAFSVILRREGAGGAEEADNILIHGIGSGAQRAGTDPVEALLGFLEYVGKSPLVAYHAFFDDAITRRAVKLQLGAGFKRPWLDLAWVLPELFPVKMDRRASLDEWLEAFGIAPIQRHDAVSDAYSAAQLFQIALSAARHAGATTPRKLMALEAERRRRLAMVTHPGVPSRPGDVR
ncbi:MAG: 3'-5' exonuclease [Rhodocyclaceae bacterium]|nr:3'-5' exonuclease [Rhodocyclaceae bacterium]